MTILGIETSCDDTCLALVRDGKLVSSVSESQTSRHDCYGGIVPEVASREHVNRVLPLYHMLLKGSGKQEPPDAIACTQGPGLMGSLLVGVQFARGLSLSLGCEYIPINHLEGHVFSALINMAELPPMPWLVLIVSGGHTLLVRSSSIFEYKVLGGTTDDSVGECFDKVSRFLGLGYPGGPQIEKCAFKGAPGHRFPQSFLREKSYRFSYSGLKTSVCSYADKEEAKIEDVCASFQEAAVNPLVVKLQLAIEEEKPGTVIVAGGVSANSLLRERINCLAEKHAVHILMPEKKWAMDNAAMIAQAAYFRKQKSCYNHGFASRINPNWSLN